MPDQSSTVVQPTGAVHPVAALFPMMSEEELDDLAADIAANGLVHPIVLDAEGTLIDGRNRLEACRRMGVEPVYASLNGHDPVAFILSANVARRHMTKGQLALAVAKAQRSKLGTLQRGEQIELASQLGVTKARLSEAVTILENAPELAEQVLTGDLALVQAYTAAATAKRVRKSAEDEAREHAAKMERLRAGAPDLADQVEDHRLELDVALVVLEERRRKEREREEEEQKRREATTHMVHRAVVTFYPAGWTPEQRATLLLEGLLPQPLPDGTPLTDDVWEAVEATVRAMRVLRKEAA